MNSQNSSDVTLNLVLYNVLKQRQRESFLQRYNDRYREKKISFQQHINNKNTPSYIIAHIANLVTRPLNDEKRLQEPSDISDDYLNLIQSRIQLELLVNANFGNNINREPNISSPSQVDIGVYINNVFDFLITNQNFNIPPQNLQSIINLTRQIFLIEDRLNLYEYFEELLTFHQLLDKYGTQEEKKQFYTFEEDSDDYKPIETKGPVQFTDFQNKEIDPDCFQETNLTNDQQKWINEKCYNCKSEITLETFDKDAFNEIVSVMIQDSNNNFSKGFCFQRSDFVRLLSTDIDQIPANIAAIWKSNPQRPEDLLTGIPGTPSSKIVVKLPSANIFVTLLSAYRVLYESNRVWYALPLFGGKRRRIGNLGGVPGIGNNHGQLPGFKVYKLYSQEELETGVSVIDNKGDYPLCMYIADNSSSILDILQDSFNSNKQLHVNFSNMIINSLIKPYD